MSADYIIARLEDAGATLLSLPSTACMLRMRSAGIDPLCEALLVRGATPQNRSASGAAVARMDEALAWISLIPLSRFVLRRIVAARALVNPETGKNVFAWRRLATAIGTDHKAVKRWHAQGIDLIASALGTAP